MIPPIMLCITRYIKYDNAFCFMINVSDFFRTPWQDGPSSQGVCFSIWRRIGSGGIALYQCQTAIPSASMRAKQ